MLSDIMTGNATVLSALFAELEALGVEEFCVAAGARNAALVAALAERKSVRLRHFFEERCAAFFALGRVMKDRRPVAVVTTSGTAAAELLPAMIEAHYQHLPLIAITADRPSRYRGSGAPQAIEQVGLFGPYAGRAVELEADGEGGLQRSDTAPDARGPIHFNVCLDESLSELPQDAGKLPLPARLAAVTDDARHAWVDFWAAEGDLLVLASGIHPEDVPQARDFLLELQAPIVAEATSNLLAVPELAPLLLRGGERAMAASRPARVLRLGAVPSWRWWRDLEDRAELPVLSVSRAPFRGLARTGNVAVVPWEMLALGAPRPCPPAGMPSAVSLPDALLEEHPHSEAAWMRHLSRIIPAGALVFLGNSLPIREWNLAADRPRAGTMFYANRGANGIDGLVSTWLGLSAEGPEAWLILGDLSALYDLAAPWVLGQLAGGKRRIVVINNGGGKIFSRVGWLRGLDAASRGIIENRHDVGFEPWARLWGLGYRLLTDCAGLVDDASPCAIWEVRPDTGQTEAFWAAWGRQG